MSTVDPDETEDNSGTDPNPEVCPDECEDECCDDEDEDVATD